MEARRARVYPGDKKAWYCLEFYDETRDYHAFSAAYTTEEEALAVLRQADKIAPPTTHIYYWRQDDKPIADPPGGHSAGPLAKPQK